MDWPQLIHDWWGAVTAVAAFVLATWRFCALPCYRLICRANDAMERVESMSQSFTKNGGKSLADLIQTTADRALVNGTRLDALFDQLNRPIWEFDPSGENVRINSTFSMEFGWTPAEMLERRWVRSIHEEDKTRVMSEWWLAIGDRRIFDAVYRLRTKAGMVVNVRSIVEPSFHPATGAVIRWIGRIENQSKEAVAA